MANILCIYWKVKFVYFVANGSSRVWSTLVAPARSRSGESRNPVGNCMWEKNILTIKNTRPSFSRHGPRYRHSLECSAASSRQCKNPGEKKICITIPIMHSFLEKLYYFDFVLKSTKIIYILFVALANKKITYSMLRHRLGKTAAKTRCRDYLG